MLSRHSQKFTVQRKSHPKLNNPIQCVAKSNYKQWVSFIVSLAVMAFTQATVLPLPLPLALALARALPL